jgi:ubiquinone/menaquinone biosynthesis C-methylase UbiE
MSNGALNLVPEKERAVTEIARVLKPGGRVQIACTSIAVMRELKLTTVITTDRHFRQVGFDVLPAARAQRARRPRRS